MELSHDAIERIVASYDASLIITEHQRITTGNINTLYDITTTAGPLILRIVPEAYEYKIGKERAVFELIRTHTGIPVPRTLVVDRSKRIIPYAYVIMEKLPGMMLRFTALSDSERDGLYEVLGSTLAQVHAITLPHFGWILESGVSRRIDRESEPFETWSEAFLDAYRMSVADLATAEPVGSIDPQVFLAIVPRIDAILKHHENNFAHVRTPALLHGDYTLRNVLVERDPWRVTGLLDVEFARAGHNEFEVASVDHFLCDLEDMLGYSKHAERFLSGYTTVKPLSEGFEQRRLMYLLVSLFSLAVNETFKEKINSEEESLFLYRSILRIIEQ